MQERDSHFLRRQAELCIGLSRSTFDLTLAGRLRAMAEEFRAKADAWEDENDVQPEADGKNGSQSGWSRKA
jgi:hypothetical protein